MLTRYTQKNLTWIDLVAPTPEEVRLLMREFGISPLIGQELLSVSVKSKIERYDDTIYAVLHFPVLRGTHIKRTTQEVDLILGRDYLITTRYIESLRDMTRTNNSKVIFMPVETSAMLSSLGAIKEVLSQTGTKSGEEPPASPPPPPRPRELR